ncbi:MAG: SDR family oxidoreductase [Deltaproteobacteria bacterium]|nr:SDR family oxidoreductase [Deltaproteobacteria bacterium]
MVNLNLQGRNALVTGVADDGGFGWAIAKALKAAGARVYLASHPRVVGIVERILRRGQNAEARALPYGLEGEFQPDGLFGCDVEYDRFEDIPEEKRSTKAYKEGDVSIAGAMAQYQALSEGAPLDILIHAVAFSPEIQKNHLETSRSAYLTAQSVSAYSLVAMTRAALPLMQGRNASVVGLTYVAATRMTPGYGGGMASAKAALECDARALAWFAGEHGVRVNLVSAGPFPSRAARSIGDIQAMVDHTAARSPLRRPITAEEVADATLFLCSPLSSGVTGSILFVDAGFHVMNAL